MRNRLRIWLTVLFTAVAVNVFADDSTLYPCGAVNYGQSAQALYNMTVTILIYMYYVNGVLYAIASLLSLYSATNIYLKLQYGEEGFTKSVMTLVFSILFLIASTTVMPAFFGIRSYPGGGAGYGPGQYATGYYGHSAW